ncbi:MAG: LacI family DNA-binding transcriptional regulator [Tenuifilaceae bacterium]|jgi:LacI family transcriptional regulator|uniref:LacI family DNA-binding transcriptional regulator n=1 Tax=Perlabentimonas gracilis TaxID=2715279 RepID=UPI00140A5CD1|nr:LacI family DNA-binding transcriptional regulator [Perlabentimonas gracilis]MDX9770044.1 LacI family DNA-binding transcriptional regulator [Tenuifilaceae bacterium]NHB67848.1 LacI family transcriptional regulator [Perlabentimonas gracilis]
MKSPNVTIKDIARLLGISPSTVSRALKDHPDISQATKDQVNKLAAEMNYRPNPIALSLRNRRSNVIGVVIPEIVHFFFSSVISGINKVANEHGFSVMVSQSSEDFEKEVEVCETFRHSIIDGLLISVSKHTTEYEHLRRLDEEGIPVVFFDRMIEEFNADRVLINDYEGAFEATQYLIVEGRRRIMHFAGPQSRLIGKNRLKGYLEAHRKNGVVIDESLVINCDNFESALVQTQRIIDEGVKFDAIFTVNDFTAAGVVKTLVKNGIKVPEDVSVIGFGNDYMAEMIEPTLTTVCQPGFTMGEKAMQMLINRINSEKTLEPKTEVLPTKLIIRNTTKKR